MKLLTRRASRRRLNVNFLARSQQPGSPTTRAQRAKLPAQRVKHNSAQGKRKRRPGLRSFPVWRASSARQEKEKREVGWGVFLPRAAASAALPWVVANV